jgi:hypothetical protein
VFNVGAGEITVLCLLALILLGPSKRPALAQLVRPRAARRAPRWSWSDWLLVSAAALSFTAALAAVTSARR